MEIIIRTTNVDDTIHASMICDWYIKSSEERGTGIALRTEAYVSQKMSSGNAVIAMEGETLLGFCYIETFEGAKYVSNSGLIIGKYYRGKGIAKKIKKEAVNLARQKYPRSKIFGITTSNVVMKINSGLGYIPVAFDQLTSDTKFWDGCKSCKNYDILIRNERKMCLCTGMLAPSSEEMKIDLSNLIINEND